MSTPPDVADEGGAGIVATLRAAGRSLRYAAGPVDGTSSSAQCTVGAVRWQAGGEDRAFLLSLPERAEHYEVVDRQLGG